jgi:hypothetical protein
VVVVSFVARPVFLTVGSFYGVQVLGNFCYLAFYSLYACSDSIGIMKAYEISMILSFFGISVLGTNLLCHRYLLEKAKILSKMYVTLSPSLPTSGECLELTDFRFCILAQLR